MSEITSRLNFSYLNKSTWNNFSNQTKNSMDGIKIQTNANDSFYLEYRTLNQGRTAYYPYVKSNINDYAGAPGKAIQQLQIQAFQKNGTKLTDRIIVMYRANVDGEWLPWVSNADPEWMRSVHSKYNLDGSLDTTGSFAGKTGKNISGIEIRVFEEKEEYSDFSGDEITPSLSYMADNASDWNSFNRSTVFSHFDGIKIQTEARKGYYLSYKTWNAGQSTYYPAVKSTDNDYAGVAGKPIERLNIQVYKNDGTQLTSGVIVMYRAYVGGKWLPWVSNAAPEWMRNVKIKYSLDGTLDTSGSYAGKPGESLQGIEVRIFENDSFDPGADLFDGNEINLSLSYMADNDSTWNAFHGSVLADHMDGIKIQTPSNESFYLTYQTFNKGQTSFYPSVTSRENDYAGSAGKPIQQVRIQAYANDGTKLANGIIVMYRTYANGRWLPWVSNADPESMRSVHMQYNLDGTLDTASSYAGISGTNIGGIEIRVFSGRTNSSIVGTLPGTEATPTLSYMFDTESNWKSFVKNVTADHIDGIKIQTSSNKAYYLSYKTLNSGKTYYYPDVKSTVNDYAGSAGKPIQCLSIRAYRNDGVQLTTGVVVMYRTYTDGKWLPWVSNADPEWMRSVQTKYRLDGSLDTSSSYAGIVGKNIQGIEIRIFEENNADILPITPTGKYKIIEAPLIYQMIDYPTGCESVSTVMALQHAGLNISVDNFIDTYLPKSGTPFDPNLTFGGNPRSTSGFGCYAPVIKNALDKLLADKMYSAKVLNGVPLADLCSQYIDKDIPVIIWATMDMRAPYNGASWMYNGKKIQWIAPEHCLLLVGYDDYYYIFNDPQKQTLTYYNKSAVETAYAGLFSQAIVIEKTSESEVDFSADKKYLTAEEYLKVVALQVITGKYYPTADGLNTISDYEKISALYDCVNQIRSNHAEQYLNDPTGKKIYNAVFPNKPNTKTTKVIFERAILFTPEVISEMNLKDEVFQALLGFLPTGSFWTLLMDISQAIENGEDISLMGLTLSATNKVINHYAPYAKEFTDNLFKWFDLVFTMEGIREAAENDDYHIVNGVKMYPGDGLVELKVIYDLGMEKASYFIYFRNGTPILVHQYGPSRNDCRAEGYINIGSIRADILKWKDDGYVPSKYHLERSPYFYEYSGLDPNS